MKQPIVYIVTNKKYGTLYTGVTSNIIQRIYQHKNDFFKGFSKKYGCKILVFFELHETMECAIMREKQVKNYPRVRKIRLIEDMNLEWRDLYDQITL